MRLLKNMGNSCLNSYSVEKAICNMNLSVLQELWILPVLCMSLRISGGNSQVMMGLVLVR